MSNSAEGRRGRLLDQGRDMKANGRGFCAGHDVSGPGPGPRLSRNSSKRCEAGHPWGGPATLFLWPMLHLWEFQKPTVAAVQGYAWAGAPTTRCSTTSSSPRRRLLSMPLPQGLGFPAANHDRAVGDRELPWHLTYLYLSQTVDAQEAHRLGMVNRVVPNNELDTTAELIANQIAQAPLSVLMGIKAGVKRAWEGMGMRVHIHSHLQVMEAVGRAGDVAAWRQENAEKGYGTSPRQVAAKRAEAAAAAVVAKADA